MDVAEIVEYLRCPLSGSALRLVDIDRGQRAAFVCAPRKGGDIEPIVQATDRMLIAEDGASAYPIVDGFPVLLGPERLLPATRDAGRPVDLRDPLYAEAYEEMKFYNSPHASPPRDRIMGALEGYGDFAAIALGFPEPARVWVDAPHESLAQLEAYRYLAPVADKTVLQIGGSGPHAVKLLLAGARRGFLVTPMLAEARYAARLASDYGVRDRFAPVLGVGEQIPLAAEAVDLVFSGGCFHHMRWRHLGGELHRVLAEGGKFAGTDPWKTPLHTIGTRMLGKRESQVHCRPVTPKRLTELRKWFPDLTVRRHGPLLRYVFLGLDKLSRGRFRPSPGFMMTVMRVDDFLGRAARLERYGGALVVAGTKSRSKPVDAVSPQPPRSAKPAGDAAGSGPDRPDSDGEGENDLRGPAGLDGTPSFSGRTHVIGVVSDETAGR